MAVSASYWALVQVTAPKEVMALKSKVQRNWQKISMKFASLALMNRKVQSFLLCMAMQHNPRIDHA